MSPTRAATSTRFAAATILNPIADTGISIENSSAWAELFARDNCEPRSKNALIMLIRTLYFEQASIIAAVVCSLIVAGLLKGIIGVGMPRPATELLSKDEVRRIASNIAKLPELLTRSSRCIMKQGEPSE